MSGNPFSQGRITRPGNGTKSGYEIRTFRNVEWKLARQSHKLDRVRQSPWKTDILTQASCVGDSLTRGLRGKKQLSVPSIGGRSVCTTKCQREEALHPKALARTHESLVGDCRSCSVEPRLLVQVTRRDKRRSRHLLRVKPESRTSRVVLTSRNRPRDCFGLEMIVEAGEILIRVVLPQRKRRNGAILLSLGPVKDVLVLVWTGKRRHGRGERVNCDVEWQ